MNYLSKYCLAHLDRGEWKCRWQSLALRWRAQPAAAAGAGRSTWPLPGWFPAAPAGPPPTDRAPPTGPGAPAPRPLTPRTQWCTWLRLRTARREEQRGGRVTLSFPWWQKTKKPFSPARRHRGDPRCPPPYCPGRWKSWSRFLHSQRHSVQTLRSLTSPLARPPPPPGRPGTSRGARPYCPERWQKREGINAQSVLHAALHWFWIPLFI